MVEQLTPGRPSGKLLKMRAREEEPWTPSTRLRDTLTKLYALREEVDAEIADIESSLPEYQSGTDAETVRAISPHRRVSQSEVRGMRLTYRFIQRQFHIFIGRLQDMRARAASAGVERGPGNLGALIAEMRAVNVQMRAWLKEKAG